MKRIKLQTLILTLLIMGGLTLQAHAQETAELTASQDNTIFEDSDNLSNGSGQFIFAGRTASSNNQLRRRALLRFDLSALTEANATIQSVELHLFLSKSISDNVPMRLHESLKDWGEGSSDAGGQEGKGTTAQNGDATWANTFFPNATWDAPGGDFNGSAVASANVGRTNGEYTWTTTQAFAELVQKWVDNPEENFGLFLIGDESAGSTAKRFHSSESSVSSQRPMLVVQYTTTATSTEEENSLPESISLEQNFPNPFNPSTVIRYSVPQSMNVQLTVTDLTGRQVAELVNGRRAAGEYEAVFNATGLSSGVYIYRLQAGNRLISRKLTLIK